MLKTIQLAREHYLNPLHIMCRGIDLGLSRDNAIRISKILTFKLWGRK